MRIRLTRFEGLPLSLRPGWYELPSHIEADEVRRLLDILADALPGIADVVECEWAELDSGLELGASTLAFVVVPEAVEHGGIAAKLSQRPVRLGLYEHKGAGRWPEVAWDEIEVKRALLAVLRKSLRKPEHPLAKLGVGDLPIDLLAEATCEPIELLVLIESTIEYAVRQHEQGPIDWLQCARWSIGRRLANRLGEVERQLRGSVRARIAESRDGTLSRLHHPREVDELVRLGLAHSEEGDALLVPLARLATEQRVVEILDLEGVTAPLPVAEAPHPHRERATSPSEAVVAFDPLTPIGPDDPWFVDLRPIVPEIHDFGRRFNQQLERRDRNIQLAILQQPGGGGSTMIRRLLHELGAGGLVSIDVRAPSHADFGFVELLIRMMSTILAHCEADNSALSVPAPVLTRLRTWLAEYCLEGELREYVRLGADIMERARIPSLLMILQRVLDRSGGDSPERARIRPALDARTDELLGHLAEILAGFRGQLIARGQQLCIHIDSSEHLDAKSVDRVFVAHAADLARLDCHVVFSVGLASEYLPVQQPVSAVYTSLIFPVLDGGDSSMGSALLHVLAARAELDQVFEQPAAIIMELAERAHSSLRRGLELAKRACEATERGLVGVEAIGIGIGEGSSNEIQAILADEWPIINDEIMRREQAGEDVHALRRALAEGRPEGEDLHVFQVLANRYRLLEIAGNSAFTTLWRAWDRNIHSMVALRVLDAPWSRDPERLDGFVRGAKPIAALNHPGIVPVLGDHVQDGSWHFHVMKWMAHGSLVQAISSGKIPSIDRLCSLAVVAEGLDAAHRSGVVHGDVQPNKIMFDDEDQAAITAFWQNASQALGLGTRAYAAPEQLMATGVGPKADVYGLGMTVLYCLLEYDPPVLVASTEPKLLERLPCSAELAKAVTNALAYAPSERAPDCSALAQALHHERSRARLRQKLSQRRGRLPKPT